MDIWEVAGFKTGVDRAGVNFLDPKDAFETLLNGYIYRQELKSRLGFSQFGNRLSDGSRVMGIFENVLPDSTKDLLVISKQFLYKYNSSTQAFDQIPMAGAAPAGGFAIAADDDYVSGTTYLTKTGSQRFVFTGKGMSDVYFYNGTNVQSFTLNNPDFQQPAASIGNLIRATTVIWFGERLNFFIPVTTVATYNQGVLYSGIRDASGNGDKFNVPGAGLLSCDTYELMKGAIILGDVVIMNLQRSNWALEKTRDAFNPYFTRKIPSVLGTDAGFSAVSWNYEVKSAGRTGMITTDARQSLRFDNKIPFVTSDDFDQSLFEYTYGGFDRINGQFLFSYRSNDSDLVDVTQDKVLVYNYEESTWSLNDQRFSVFGQSNVGTDLIWDDIDETKDPSWGRMDTTEQIWNRIGVGAQTQKTLAGDNDGFVYQINEDFDDYFVDVSAITQAANAVVTIGASAFKIGDRVVFNNVLGMLEINNKVGTVVAASLTSITVDINSTNFTAYASGGTASKVIAFEATMSPFNPYRDQGRKVYVSHVEVLLNVNAGDITADVYEDEEPYPFKTALLESPQQTIANISAITQANQAVLTIDSQGFVAGDRVKISEVQGMVEINGLTVKVLSVTDTTMTIDLNTSGFSAYTAAGIVSDASATTKARVWIEFTVDQESNFLTFSFNNESAGAQTIISSIRIHCSVGAFTSS